MASLSLSKRLSGHSAKELHQRLLNLHQQTGLLALSGQRTRAEEIEFFKHVNVSSFTCPQDHLTSL